MNNLDKKIDLLRTIISLAVEITNKSTTDIFVDYSGHVDSLTVKVLLNGWKHDENDINLYKIIYLNKNCVNELNEIIDYLKNIKEEI